MSQRCFIDHENKLVYFWSQKGACTSLSNWFYYKHLGMPHEQLAAEKVVGGPRNWLAKHGMLAVGTVGVGLARQAGYTSLAFARNPASRALSGFLNKFVVYTGNYLTEFDGLEGFAKNVICQVQGKNRVQVRSNYTGISFVDFIGHVTDVTENTPIESEPALDPHWAPQVSNMMVETDFRYDHIFHIEEIEKAEKWLSERLGKPVELGRTNVTKYEDNDLGDLSHISCLELANRGARMSPANFLTDDVIALIKQAYRHDYSHLGYE